MSETGTLAISADERIMAISRKVQKDAEIAREKERIEQEKINSAIAEIKALKPRIDNLIKVANFAVANGIRIDGGKYCSKYTHSNNVFYSSGISHIVGFIRANPISAIGINNGGCCGSYDFHTNGNDVYSIHEDTHEIIEPKLYDMNRFIMEFDSFESSFYSYIDNCCK